MSERPDEQLVERYRECYGTGPEAAAFLREVAAGWEETGSRPHDEFRTTEVVEQ